MEIKIMIGDLEVDNELFNTPKEIKENLKELKTLFPYVVENISLVSFFNLDRNGK